MKKVGTITIADQVFDLAMGPGAVYGAGADGSPLRSPHRAALGRRGLDLYENPVVFEVDLESEIQVIGNVAVVEALLLLLAHAMQERDAARSALQKGAGFDL